MAEHNDGCCWVLQAGLQKMVEAKEDVNKMKAELAIKNQELAAASKEAEALLKSISESTAVAEKGTLNVNSPHAHSPVLGHGVQHFQASKPAKSLQHLILP
jgi:hypothetical protein